MGDVGQPQMAAREMLVDLVDADAVEKVAEYDVFSHEAPLKGPDVRAERVGDLADRGATHGHEDPDRLLDFLRD